ncbi:CGNR zinc finger domain-containing protein [Streptomyces sp. NPDC020490]|uniref:CGNR zinc finger domain-containing protein n=1 Tax=Streptomyces sp. NPDC020490 TaxID=3365078 RepID=UPI0037BB3DEB
MKAQEQWRPLPPAPGSVDHPGIGLANTLQVFSQGTYDLLADHRGASLWAVESGLAGQGTLLGDPCTGRLRTLRHHVRQLFTAAVARTEPPAASIDAVNSAIRSAPSNSQLAWDAERGMHRVVSHPLDELTDYLLAAVARDAVELLCGPDAPKLAACGASPCSRFYLRTHGARQWCSVRCGDRVRAARAYRRKGPA